MAKAADKSKEQKVRDKWITKLDDEAKANEKARNRAQKVIDRYRDEEREGGSKINILWANVSVLNGALYSATPKPDVRRRFLDKDQVSRESATVIERALAFTSEAYDFDGMANTVLKDYLLPGYGMARVRYKPYFEKKPNPTEDDPEGVTETLAYEEIQCEPVRWKNFRWDHTATRWEDVNWCAIDHYLDRTALVEQFGDVGKDVELTHGPQNGKKDSDSKTIALVHEIFDKRQRKIIVVSPGYKSGPVVVWDDPLNLTGFYPFPKPMFATQTDGELMPIPDYAFYQDQAQELDEVTARIAALVDMLKVRGVYDQSFEELVNVLNTGDGKLTPVKDFAARFGDGRDIESVIAFMPLKEIAEVVAGLYQQRDQLKQSIYELTGISDIVRGQTVASETLGAQQLKGRFADMRLNSRRSVVNAFFRDLFRIKAEIIAEKFSPDTLKLMTGIQITPEIDQILKSDVLRAYKIDVETDSTIAEDAAEEQKSRTEALGGLTTFLQAAVPAVQAQLVPPELAKELALFLVRGFKKARQLEDVIERIGGQDGEDPKQALMQAQQQLTGLQQQLQQAQAIIQEGTGRIQQLEQEANSKAVETKAKNDIEIERMNREDARHKATIDAEDRRIMFKSEMENKRAAESEAIKSQQQGDIGAQSISKVVTMVKEILRDDDAKDAEEMSALQQQINALSEGFNQLAEIVQQSRPSPEIDVEYGADGRIASVNGRSVKRRSASRTIN